MSTATASHPGIQSVTLPAALLSILPPCYCSCDLGGHPVIFPDTLLSTLLLYVGTLLSTPACSIDTLLCTLLCLVCSHPAVLATLPY